MTFATRSKIAKQQQKKQKLQWQMDAYRSISTPLIEFQQKYLYYNSSTNLSKASFFGKTKVTANGSNASNLSISGSTHGTTNLTILEVKQLAKDASKTLKGVAGGKSLVVGGEEGFNLSNVSVNSLKGKSLTLKRGTDEKPTYYTLKFLDSLEDKDGILSEEEKTLKYDTATDIAASIQKMITAGEGG